MSTPVEFFTLLAAYLYEGALSVEHPGRDYSGTNLKHTDVYYDLSWNFYDGMDDRLREMFSEGGLL